MEIAELTLPVEALWLGATPPDLPLAFVVLDDRARDRAIAPPPYPVIGIGARDHPLARSLDAVIEPPFTPARLAANVAARPRAAAVSVSLLRLLPALDPPAGLAAESMAYAMLQGSAEHRAWLATCQARPASAPGAVMLTREDDRLTVTLDRAHAGNAIDRAMRDALHEALSFAVLDPTIAAVNLRAAGRAFCLGADLSEFGTTTDPATAHTIRARTLPAHAAAACARKLSVHVGGACIGAGLELAAWARRLTAGRDAWFQLPELAMGILPGAGGCVSLTRRIGRQRTALLVLSGRRLPVSVARDWGLVDAIVDEPPGAPHRADVG